MGAIAIQILLRRSARLSQVGVALVVGFGVVGFGFFFNLIEHHQELTGRNFITLADLEFLNPTPRLSSELDQVACLQGADGVDTLSEFSQLGGDGLHLRRRRLRRFALAGTDCDQSREGEQESLRMTHGKRAFAGL